ncbi:MAG: SRPBCC family protein [Pseudooceanicola sp.]
MPKKLAYLLIVLSGTLVLGFGAFVAASLFHDRDNPRDRPNSYLSKETVIVDRPVEEVFEFVQHGIPELYTRMSPMHERFEILNAEALVLGAEVDCIEGDPDEIVQHRYVVTRVEAPTLLVMESLGTRIIDRASGETTAEIDVWVYFDLRPLEDGRTEMAQTVVMGMRNPVFKAMIDVLAFVSGERALWEQQFVEELEVLGAHANDYDRGRNSDGT